MYRARIITTKKYDTTLNKCANLWTKVSFLFRIDHRYEWVNSMYHPVCFCISFLFLSLYSFVRTFPFPPISLSFTQSFSCTGLVPSWPLIILMLVNFANRQMMCQRLIYFNLELQSILKWCSSQMQSNKFKNNIEKKKTNAELMVQCDRHCP